MKSLNNNGLEILSYTFSGNLETIEATFDGVRFDFVAHGGAVEFEVYGYSAEDDGLPMFKGYWSHDVSNMLRQDALKATVGGKIAA